MTYYMPVDYNLYFLQHCVQGGNDSYTYETHRCRGSSDRCTHDLLCVAEYHLTTLG